MKRIKIKDLFINISLLVFATIAMLRSYVDAFLGNKITVLLYGISICVLIIVCVNRKNAYNNTGNYPLFLILFILPSLYKNYYLKDEVYSLFFYYFMTCIFFVLLSFTDITKKNINFIMNLFIVFAIATSIVTWISIISPNFYTTHIVTLFPKVNQSEILYNFTRLKSRSGLCTHYSRNAFFIILGILGMVYHYLEDRKKTHLIIILFLIISLYMVGKRGHLIFFIISFIITYFVFYRVTFKTIFKFLGIALILVVLTGVAINVNDEVGYVFERLMNNNTTDVSNGRYGMYEDIWNQFRDNGYMPLGWAEYASSTNYVHPGVHNDYIQLLCETGVIGFLLIVGLNIRVLIFAIKYAHETKSAISFIILLYNWFFLLYSLTGLPHYDIETYMYYFLINFILFHELFSKEEGMRFYE